jgi:hypothetical protein
MPVETTVAQNPAVKYKRDIDKRSPAGSWEMHCWGDGGSSCMVAFSAITTLQLGATLSSVPADQVALNKAAEYLLEALASQLKPFQQKKACQQDEAGLRERTNSGADLA